MNNITTCYYCEENPSVAKKHNQPICNVCSEKEVRTLNHSLESQRKEEKALRLKLIISMSKKTGESQQQIVY